jgi:hypothetical protein
MLTADSYRVDPARNEQEAVVKGRRQRPDLILVSLNDDNLRFSRTVGFDHCGGATAYTACIVEFHLCHTTAHAFVFAAGRWVRGGT